MPDIEPAAIPSTADRARRALLAITLIVASVPLAFAWIADWLTAAEPDLESIEGKPIAAAPTDQRQR